MSVPRDRVSAGIQPKPLDHVHHAIRWLRCSAQTGRGYVDDVRCTMASLLCNFALRLMEDTRPAVHDRGPDHGYPKRRWL